MNESMIFLFMQFECIKINFYNYKLNCDGSYLFMAILNMHI
ncbi:hypothetical protein ykris0001_11360 [Yersinia kristensenii ATCC 33638]|nr:hypothetical protein ykris0001_11360 [Yersinia kristensenii ATCC 33638]